MTAIDPNLSFTLYFTSFSRIRPPKSIQVKKFYRNEYSYTIYLKNYELLTRCIFFAVASKYLGGKIYYPCHHYLNLLSFFLPEKLHLSIY